MRACKLCSAAAVMLALAPLAPAHAAGSEVISSGSIERYTGPLGAGIFNNGVHPVLGSDTTWFRDRASGNQGAFSPTVAYDGYPWPAFGGAGTGKTNLFKLATLSFTNGTWFASEPPIDPGLGTLYPTSIFGFSLGALPSPQIGTPTFPNGAHVYQGGITLTSTFGPGTDDYLSIGSVLSSPAGYMAVQEGQTGTVEL